MNKFFEGWNLQLSNCIISDVIGRVVAISKVWELEFFQSFLELTEFF